MRISTAWRQPVSAHVLQSGTDSLKSPMTGGSDKRSERGPTGTPGPDSLTEFSPASNSGLSLLALSAWEFG